MPYDYEDISTLNDRDLRDLALEYELPGVPNLRQDGMTLNPADRERLILQLRKKGVNTRSNAEFNINEQIIEYEFMFPDDHAEKQMYMARVPPQTGVRGGTTTGDYESWYTIYTTPGAAAFLEERGYEVRAPDNSNGVVVQMPRHRRRTGESSVQIEAPYGQHHLAPVHDLEARRRRQQ